MRKQILQRSAVFILALTTGLTARAQSAYFEAMTNLNPAVYLPMQEQVLAPQNDVETNLGSLGVAGNAVYNSINDQKQNPGATGDGDDSVNFDGTSGGFMAVPLTEPGVVLPVGPFSAEAWVFPTTYGREGIVGQSGPIGTGGLTGSANAAGSAGWTLTENDIPSANASTVGWAFHVYNGNGSVGSTAGAEAYIVTPYPLNQWYHVVGVFDGTNCQLYIDATNISSFGSGSNTVVSQYPMTGTQAQDTWDQLTIGSARGLNNNLFNGRIDEVAIYTNALTLAQIQAHYNAASGSSSYATTILGNNPYMYWRMDAPTFTAAAQSGYPAAVNYGSLPVTTDSGSQGSTYGPASQPGMSGPQFPGLMDPNNDDVSLAVAFNGVGGDNGSQTVSLGNNLNAAVALPLDLGIDSQGILNVTNLNTFSFSCSVWFKCNPSDNRFQNLFGHSDNSWRSAIDTTGKLHFKGGSAGTEFTSVRVYNDGNWHQMVGTMTGTSENLYVDGVLDSTTTSSSKVENGCAQDVIIGADPEYMNSGNGTYVLQEGIGAHPNTTNFNSGGAPGRYFSGSLAHFAFFTNALTAAQVQTLYSAAETPPVILAQPLSGRVDPASAFLFFGVVASGASTLNYQWYFTPTTNYSSGVLLTNGLKYSSATTLQITVSNLVDSDSGNYYVVITNNYGSVTSALASVSINDEPIITAQSPSNSFTLYSNQSQIFSVTATTDETNAAPFLWYQWYTNGVADPSGTNSTYTTVSLQAANVGTAYQCVVTNLYGSATNQPVSLLSLLTAPAIPAAISNSVYGSNILALNPTAYWPMHEVEPPLVQRDIETNYGTLGQVADAYYGDWQINNGAPSNTAVIHLSPSPLAGDSDPSAEFTGGAGSYAVIPRTSLGTTIQAPFTLEAWVKPMNNSFGIILGCGDLTTNHGPNSVDAFGGFDWLWAGTANTFSITMRSGPTNTGASTAAAASTEPKTTANYYPGQWYHLVTTYDGTNITYYVDGQLVGLQNSSAATLAPNTWEPLTIGGGRWTGAINNQFVGNIDELAVYTNLLSPTTIQQHFTDGTSPTGNYKQDVLAGSPILYYRMDSSPYATPPQSTWPTLTNYGSVPVQGVYRPNAAPGGVAGPAASGLPYAGFSANTALQGDGNSVFADAGFDPSFNPTGHTPFTVAAWMKGNPADDSDRNWQSMVGHSDSGWRLNINAGDGRANFNAGPGGGSDLGNNTTTAQVNDGNWHYMVGTYNGSNGTIYVDGKLSVTSTNTTAITGTTLDVFLGSYPLDTNYNASRQFAGNMCEAAYWYGTALTSNQIATLYTAAEIPPTIGTQPTSGSANQNGSYTNKVSVSAGNAPFTYQWYENGASVSGQTNTALILSPVIVADASSNWFVVVSNPYGSVTSSVVSLTVFSSPTITQEPTVTNMILFAGGQTTFSIAASGAVPLYYYWYSNSVVIAGATNASYSLTNAESPGQTNLYYCLVSNAPGTAASIPIQIAVIPAPTAPYPVSVLAADPVGFWRLNDPEVGGGDGGQIAYDYWGGNNGVYTNVTLDQPGYNPNETNETSCEFGVNSFVNGDVYGIPNINFSAVTNSSTNFTIEAWAKGYQQTVDAGIVSKGYGGGGEQFIVDCGSDTTNAANPVAHSFRFFVRDALSGATHSIVSNVNPADNSWHHLVGVCNETAGYVAFYIDGQLAGTNTITPGSGILSSTRSMLIGARPSNSTTNLNDLQFVGWIADVAVYNYALSSNQIVNQYNGADIPAAVITQPTNTVANQGGTAIFTAVVEGTPVVAMQWYDVNAGNQPIANQTNATLVLSNVQTDDSYYLQVANAFGTNTSQTASLNVYSGMPVIAVDVPPQIFIMENATTTIPVTVEGSLPFTYQWQFDGVNLADNSVYSGSQSSNVLTIANAQPANVGSYQLIVSNSFGSVTSSVSSVLVGSLPLSLNNGLGWQAEQSGAYTSTEFTNGLLTLTDGGGSEARSFFFEYPQYIGAFTASYTYQDVSVGGADGVSFMLQNDPRGAAALGGDGGSLGVSGVTPSCELEFNVYAGSADGLGYNIFTNGATGTNIKLGNGSATVEGTNELGSGDPVNVTVSYSNPTLTLTFVDAVDSYTFTTNINVGNLETILGGPTAYVGFTGADGGTASTQTITNFTFVSIPTEAIQVGSGNALITWPSIVTGYSLEQSTNLLMNWSAVTNVPTIVNGQYQVLLPAGQSSRFYRLTLSLNPGPGE